MNKKVIKFILPFLVLPCFWLSACDFPTNSDSSNPSQEDAKYDKFHYSLTDVKITNQTSKSSGGNLVYTTEFKYTITNDSKEGGMCYYAFVFDYTYSGGSSGNLTTDYYQNYLEAGKSKTITQTYGPTPLKITKYIGAERYQYFSSDNLFTINSCEITKATLIHDDEVGSWYDHYTYDVAYSVSNKTNQDIDLNCTFAFGEGYNYSIESFTRDLGTIKGGQTLNASINFVGKYTTTKYDKITLYVNNDLKVRIHD